MPERGQTDTKVLWACAGVMAHPPPAGNSIVKAALLANWIWGLSLTALTIAIHATSVTFMVSGLHRFRVRLASRSPALPRVFAIVIGTITTMGLLLAALHMIEAAIWAAAYLWLGAFESLDVAILFSVDSITTRGASGIMPPSRWRMMGALEAADGVLLFGISTAFTFTVMQFYYQHLVFRARSKTIEREGSVAKLGVECD